MSTLVANDDTASTTVNTPVNIPVLSNDTLNEGPVTIGDLSSMTISSPPAVGSAVVEPDGTITYTPPAGFCGQVTFQYTIEAEAEVGCIQLVAYGGLSFGLGDGQSPPDWWGAEGSVIRLSYEENDWFFGWNYVDRYISEGGFPCEGPSPLLGLPLAWSLDWESWTEAGCADVTIECPGCPELLFRNGEISVEDLVAAFPDAEGNGNIYFTGPDEVTYSWSSIEGQYVPDNDTLLPCSPEDPPYPWQVQLEWGDGGGNVCAMVSNVCE